MCMYDFYYLSRKKQIKVIISVALVVGLIAGIVCFVGYQQIQQLRFYYVNYYVPDAVVSSPDGQHELVVRELGEFFASEADIYIRKPGQDKWYNFWMEKKVGTTRSSDLSPFADGYYYVEWEGDKVTIYYYKGNYSIGEKKDDRSTWQGIFVYEFE